MKIALAGNPNCGKTSVFNHLTGLNQKVGNYPGITMDKKMGTVKIDGTYHTLIDLPGTYSLYPRSLDEEVVREILTNQQGQDYPDLVVVVVDASNLERSLLLFSQIYDLGLPLVLVLNMVDIASWQGMEIDHQKLSELLGGIPVIPIVARSGKGLEDLKNVISRDTQMVGAHPFIAEEFSKDTLPGPEEQKAYAEKRYKRIRQLLSFCLKRKDSPVARLSRHRKADRILTHPIWGYAIFLGILLLIFQAIFAWAEWPMNLIDELFLVLSQGVKQVLPDGPLTSLLAEGIIPGLGGVLIFIPQIAILFVFIFLLEETGYMSRVVFIMDRLMRPFGLNGKSVVPMMSGVACAIPAVMSARNIDNEKERLVTIMITPLMSCSARLPVYTVLIALVIPDMTFGIFNLKGLTLLGLYLLGLVAALGMAWVFHRFIEVRQQGFMIMELPLFKMPRWNNLTYTLYEKVKVFVLEAGKVIMAISIILWVLASYGPGDRIQKAVESVPKPTSETERVDYEKAVAAVEMENSFIGILGKGIEPVIKPLGYNWEIGIALITSFAAREVFVGTMATIYSVGENFEEEEMTLLERMRSDLREDTGGPVYTLATGLSLMVFYAFAMQCMSTLAVVRRETKTWRWPLVQLAYMTVLAYLGGFITYQLITL